MLRAIVDANLFVRGLLKGPVTTPQIEAWQAGRFARATSERLAELSSAGSPNFSKSLVRPQGANLWLCDRRPLADCPMFDANKLSRTDGQRLDALTDGKIDASNSPELDASSFAGAAWRESPQPPLAAVPVEPPVTTNTIRKPHMETR